MGFRGDLPSTSLILPSEQNIFPVSKLNGSRFSVKNMAPRRTWQKRHRISLSGKRCLDWHKQPCRLSSQNSKQAEMKLFAPVLWSSAAKSCTTYWLVQEDLADKSSFGKSDGKIRLQAREWSSLDFHTSIQPKVRWRMVRRKSQLSKKDIGNSIIIKMHRKKPHVRVMEEKEMLDGKSRLLQVGPQIAIQPAQDRIPDLKRIRILEDRYTQIEKDNRLLLEKIMNIMRTDNQKYEAPRRLRNHSGHKKREQMKIAQENQILLRKITEKKSHYSKETMDRDWKQTQQYFINLGSMRSQSQSQRQKSPSLSFAF